jgi:hypothetical protein
LLQDILREIVGRKSGPVSKNDIRGIRIAVEISTGKSFSTEFDKETRQELMKILRESNKRLFSPTAQNLDHEIPPQLHN